VHQYPVDQVCQVGRADVILRHRVLEQGQALFLQIRRRVLGQQPGCMRARLANQPVAGPSIPGRRAFIRASAGFSAVPCMAY